MEIIKKITNFLGYLFPIFPIIVIGGAIFLLAFKPEIPEISQLPPNIDSIEQIDEEWFLITTEEEKKKGVFLIRKINLDKFKRIK